MGVNELIIIFKINPNFLIHDSLANFIKTVYPKKIVIISNCIPKRDFNKLQLTYYLSRAFIYS